MLCNIVDALPIGRNEILQNQATVSNRIEIHICTLYFMESIC